jgi:hypothetical protein
MGPRLQESVVMYSFVSDPNFPDALNNCGVPTSRRRRCRRGNSLGAGRPRNEPPSPTESRGLPFFDSYSADVYRFPALV